MRAVRMSSLLASLLCLSARADVLEVDGVGGGGAYADLQQAIDAAQVGDTILVAAGLDLSWQQAVLDGKGVDIFVDQHDAYFHLGKLTIRNVPAGQRATVAGLRILTPASEQAAEFHDNAGTVRLFHVSGRGKQGVGATAVDPIGVAGETGAFIVNCAELVLVESGFLGGVGGPVLGGLQTGATDGGTGAHVVNSKVVGFHSSFGGGTGGDIVLANSPLPGSAGGTGLIAEDSVLIFHDNLASGGRGGATKLAPGGPGGDGFVQSGTLMWTVTQAAGGSGGSGGDSLFALDGPAGNDEIILDGVRTELAPNSWTRSAWATTPVRSGEPISLTVSGFQENAWLILGLDTGVKIMPSLLGALVVGAPFIANPTFLGPVPLISATFSLGAAPVLPTGLDALEVQLQIVTHSAANGYRIGAPEHVVILDPAF